MQSKLKRLFEPSAAAEVHDTDRVSNTRGLSLGCLGSRRLEPIDTQNSGHSKEENLTRASGVQTCVLSKLFSMSSYYSRARGPSQIHRKAVEVELLYRHVTTCRDRAKESMRASGC